MKPTKKNPVARAVKRIRPSVVPSKKREPLNEDEWLAWDKAITLSWDQSPERQEALLVFLSSDHRSKGHFEHSKEFANARLSYRKRINGK